MRGKEWVGRGNDGNERKEYSLAPRETRFSLLALLYFGLVAVLGLVALLVRRLACLDCLACLFDRLACLVCSQASFFPSLLARLLGSLLASLLACFLASLLYLISLLWLN